MKKKRTINRPAKAESIKKRNSKILRMEERITKNKTALKEEKKKLKDEVKDLVNSYPSVNKSKKKK